MKRHFLSKIILTPLVAITPVMCLCNCKKKDDEPEPTLIHKVTLECEAGGTIDKTWVEVDSGAKWKTAKDRIKTTPDDGKVFDSWRDEDGNMVTDDTIIDRPRTFKARWTNADFINDSWRHLCSLTNQDNGLEVIKQYYRMDSFIGYEREITLIGNKYKVRVIGENHDTLAGTTIKAPLTFQLCSLVSTNVGNVSKGVYSKAASRPDYKNTVLRKNVDGKGTGDSSVLVWDKSCLQLLKEENIDLYNNLKNVTKQYHNSSQGSENITYNTNLFVLTATEIGQHDMWTPSEGETYQYWQEHNQNSDRIMKDIKGVPYRYSLVTRRYYTQDDPQAIFYIDETGSISYQDYDKSAYGDQNYYGISFAFCI